MSTPTASTTTTTTLEAIEAILKRPFTWGDGCKVAEVGGISLEELDGYLKTDVRHLPVTPAAILCGVLDIKASDIIAPYVA